MVDKKEFFLVGRRSLLVVVSHKTRLQVEVVGRSKLAKDAINVAVPNWVTGTDTLAHVLGC